MSPNPPHAIPVDLAFDPDDELPIDLMNDSFVLDGVAKIMAEARARGSVTVPMAEEVGDETTAPPARPLPRG
jgi:hypothetical protein